MKTIRILAAIFAGLFLASAAMAVTPPEQGDYLDLTQDPYAPGGLSSANIPKELIPAYNAAVSKSQQVDEAIKFSFNYDIPKLVVAYWDPVAKKRYQRTGKLAKGTNLVGTVMSRTEEGNSCKLVVTVRWVELCANPLPFPFQATIWIPKGPASETQTIIQRVEIPKPYAVTVDRNVVVQQIVPSIGDVNITLPPAEHGSLKLTIVGNVEAGHHMEYVKGWWENFLDFARVFAGPIATLFSVPNTTISTAVGAITANGGAGGTGGIGAAAAAAAASSSASSGVAAVTPTSGAAAGNGTSGSSGSSGSSGGGPSTSGSGSRPRP